VHSKAHNRPNWRSPAFSPVNRLRLSRPPARIQSGRERKNRGPVSRSAEEALLQPPSHQTIDLCFRRPSAARLADREGHRFFFCLAPTIKTPSEFEAFSGSNSRTFPFPPPATRHNASADETSSLWGRPLHSFFGHALVPRFYPDLLHSNRWAPQNGQRSFYLSELLPSFFPRLQWAKPKSPNQVQILRRSRAGTAEQNPRTVQIMVFALGAWGGRAAAALGNRQGRRERLVRRR